MSAIRDALVEAAEGAQDEERAATIAHIRSRLLSPEEERQLDPATATAYRKREKLVREILDTLLAGKHIDGPDWITRF